MSNGQFAVILMAGIIAFGMLWLKIDFDHWSSKRTIKAVASVMDDNFTDLHKQIDALVIQVWKTELGADSDCMMDGNVLPFNVVTVQRTQTS